MFLLVNTLNDWQVKSFSLRVPRTRVHTPLLILPSYHVIPSLRQRSLERATAVVLAPLGREDVSNKPIVHTFGFSLPLLAPFSRYFLPEPLSKWCQKWDEKTLVWTNKRV
jgi:hypothetical protein